MRTNHVSTFMFRVKLEGAGALVIPTLIALGLWIWRDRYRHSHLSRMVPACQTSLWSARAHYPSWPLPLSLAEMASPLLGQPTPQAWAVLWTARGTFTEASEPPWWFSQDGASVPFSTVRHVFKSPLIQLSGFLQGWRCFLAARTHTQRHGGTPAIQLLHCSVSLGTRQPFKEFLRLYQYTSPGLGCRH